MKTTHLALALLVWAAPAQAVDLEDIQVTITSRTPHEDGTTLIDVGSGFVIGRRLYTAAHVLGGPGSHSEVDGVEIKALYSNVEEDVAVAVLPEELCANLCNDLTIDVSYTEPERVTWLRKVPNERIVKTAEAVFMTIMSEKTPIGEGCNANLVIEVDREIVHGTSGSPVMDSDTGKVIGIAQGSLAGAGGIWTGYYKPLYCLEDEAIES